MSNKDGKSQDPLTDAQKQHLKYFLTNKLTRAERLIVVLHYYEEWTMREIAEVLAKIILSKSSGQSIALPFN